MDAVGDEGGGSDPAAGPDSVERDEFVACEPDEAGRQDPAEPGKWLGSEETADGFLTGEDRGQGDHGHDEQPGEVFHPTVTVGLTA